jgi:mono/diheme cytochrome c family protein
MRNRSVPSAAMLVDAARCGAILALVLAPALAAAQSGGPPAKGGSPAKKAQIERGRYLVKIGGCNDCHTPGYFQKNGEVDEKLWLTGDKLGWSGPWGTTYAVNLRQFMAGMSEQQWVKHARTMTPRPPMPWFNVRAMTDTDLKAIHAYTRSLGPGGEPTPDFVPPGTKPAGPVVQFPG